MVGLSLDVFLQIEKGETEEKEERE